MFNKKSIGLCKLFLISIIAFANLGLAANESTSNTIPAVDTDGDGHIDWFEIDVITNGQVHPDWDYGVTGFVGFVEHEDFESAHEILRELRQSQNSRNQYLSRIRYCETNQSKKFSEFVAASKAAMQAEDISAEEQGSYICQNQEIITVVDDGNNEHAENNSGQAAESFLRASFRSLPADSELYGPYGDGYPRRDLSQFNRNTLNISRSAPLVFPEADEIYLEIEIRNSDSLGWGDFWVSLSNLGWKNQKPLYASPWGDKRCDINGEKILGPFIPNLCDFNLYRIPLKSKSTEGTNHLSNSHDFLDNIDTITLDFIRQFQYSCQWDYECVFFKASHDIRNIKIVGGDRFPNDPNEYIDSDNDGIGGNSDSDNDNDGTLNELDAFPYNPYAKADMDGDGFANLADMDRDGDGIPQSDFRLDMSNPENGWFGLNISANNYEFFYNAAIEAGCDVYDLDCYGSNLARSLNVNSDNLLLLEGNSGGVLIWEGSDYFRFDNDADNDGYIDNTTSPYSPNPEIDAFPNDPTAWADVDFDCVPDNLDNDLNSIPDTDCDGLNNSIDTDDDNDSIPDSLIVPVIVEGALDTQWSAGSNIIDETGLNLCAIEDVESNPNGSCNQLAVSHQIDNDNTESGIFKLDFQKKSVINHPGTRRGIEFKTHDYLNIYSVSFGDRFYPVGYFEVDLKLDGATGGEDLGFNLISSNKKLSQTLPLDLKTYWPKVYSGDWTSLKIPIYDFFADMQHFEQIRQFLFAPDLAKISGLRVSSNLVESAYSVNIKNIQFVIEDKYPLEFAPCCFEDGFASNDFDNDGATGANDEHPFVANIDTDNDGITDGVDDDIDGDFILNNHEIEFGTDPYNSDTDGDGVNDKRDFSPLDPADDGFLPLDISGTWRLRNKAGAIGVGRDEGSVGDWSSSDFTITERGCLFDDTYTFTANYIDELSNKSEGQFQQEMGEETWLEPWQSPNGVEECGAPQSPFDGSTPDMRYEWNASEDILILYGYGAHIAKPRVTNNLENTGAIPVDQPTIYRIATASDCLIVLDIQSAGHSPWWHFELENLACVDDDPDNGNVGGGSVGTGGSSGSGDNSNPPISMNGELYSSESFDLTVAFGAPVPATVSGPDGDIFSSPDTSATEAYAGFAFNYGQIDNPNLYNPLRVINNSKALKYIKNEGLSSSSVTITLDAPIDVSNGLEFKVRVFSGHNFITDENSPKTRDVTLKFENSTAEKTVSHDGLGWNTLTFDFTNEAISGETEITFVNSQSDIGDGTKDWTLFIDDIQQITQTTNSENEQVDVITSIMDFEAITSNSIQTNDAAAYLTDANTPLTFGAGGNITFTASVLSGETADVRFVLQRLPFDTEGNGEADTEPSYATETVTVSGSGTGFYTFEIPSQYASTFSQILLYIDTPNEAVKINDVKVFVTPASFGDVAGPFDMTYTFGNATIVDRGENNDPYYFADTSLGTEGGYPYNYEGAGYTENPLIDNPLTFGSGGKVTFIASVPYGQALNTADIRFRFEKEFSEFGDENVTKPSCDSYSVRVQGEYPTEYEIAMPVQADRTFSNMIMYIDTSDTNVLISDIRVATTPADADVVPVSCDYNFYGRQGPLDLTGAYGYGAVSGDQGELFKNDTSLGGTFGGFSNTTIELYPFEFGEGGTLEFTASVPEGQSLTEVDIEFEFQKEKSDLDKICEKAPLWRMPIQTISGSVDQSYSVNIPAQGGNTFSNMIMKILPNDVNVKITDVYVTTTEKTEDDPTVPEGCEGMSPPSVYPADDESVEDFDGAAYLSAFGIPADGFNSAAYFGAFGIDGGNTPTIQDGDTYEFPGESEDWAGWSNSNKTLYPVAFPGFQSDKYIYFCASSEPADPNDQQANQAETVSVYFKLENQPFPNNTVDITTPDVSIDRDGVMRAYRTQFATNQVSNSFLMFMRERDIEVTFGKVKGTWNGQPEQDWTTDSNNDGTPEYCDDLPNSTPGWIDSDVDGASDDYDAFPNDGNEWADSDGDGVGNNEDGCSSSDYSIDTDGDGVCDDEDYDPANPYVTTYAEFIEWLDSLSGLTQNIFPLSTNTDNSSNSESFSTEDDQSSNDSPADYLDYSKAKLLANQSGEVHIPSGYEQIGYRAFNGLDVASVTIPDSISVIESMAFRNNSRLTEVNFGQSITHIGTNAFANTVIQTVVLPSTVTYIGSHAFANSKIEQVYLGDSVEYVGDNAFAGANISSLVIPSTLKYLGENAFDYLDGDVYVIAPADQYISIFDFPSTTSFYTCLGLDAENNPADCTASYTAVVNTVFDGPAALSHIDNGHISIPDTYRSIGERAFEALKGQLTSVTIPEGITEIGSYAFKDLGLSSITLPSSVITIGDGAFAGNQLTNISLPNSLVHIGYSAFSGNSLGNVILPNSLTEIGAGAFINSGINAVVLPESLLKIEQNAFANNEITNISLPSSLKFVGERAFESNQLNSVHFQSNGSIAKYAFANNPEIELSIGENVTSIGGIDSQSPIITLNNPGEEVIIQSTSNGETIKIDSNAIRFYTEDTVYYQKSDTDLGLAISIFSDDFEDLDSVEYLPKDPSKTLTPNDFIIFDDYEHLYIQFDTQDISAKTSLNLEYRSSDATKLYVGLISETQPEDPPLRELPVNKSAGEWVSVKIPLSFYTDTDLSSIYRLYIEGDDTIDLKNIFFDGEMVEFSVQGSIVGYSEQRSQGEPYDDPGATASSIYFGNIPVEAQNVIDPNLAGSQMITYTATDLLGNTSSILREIILVDDIRPSVTLIGDSAIIVDFYSEYVDAGATAIDQVDGILGSEHLTETTTYISENVSEIVDSVDTSITGEYKINYTYTDAAGNSAETARIIIVAPPQDAVVNILIDGVIDATWDTNTSSFGNGITAFDQALNWNSCTGPGGCPSIDWEFVNDDDLDDEGATRGSVLEITHEATNSGAGIIISSTDSVDIRGGKDDGFLTFDVKVISGDTSITFKADCGYPCGGGDQSYQVTQPGQWETVAVPIASLIPNGPSGSVLDLENVKAGFVIQATSAFDSVFRIDNAYYDCRAAKCEGEFVAFNPVDWAATHEDPNTPTDDTPTSYAGYTQVWADEFNGNAVNPFNWRYDIGTGDNGWGNGELQYYRPENTSVEDGLLIIEAKKHQPVIQIGNKDAKYTSSKLKSEGLFEFKYGRVDIRAVVAKGQGMWSAGWMLGTNHSQIGWPYSGEIDIFDTIGGTKNDIPQEDMIVNNMYWNGTGSNPDTSAYAPVHIALNGSGEVRIDPDNPSNDGVTFSNKFHTFSLVWDEDKIEFQLDGETTKEVNLGDGSVLADTYRNPFYLILNVAIGGAWPGAPDETTDFPDGMLVDYVRVYQADTDGDGIADYELDGDTPLDQFPNDPMQQFYSENIGEYDSHPNGIRGSSYNISSASLDSDGDGVMDNEDAFVFDAQEWLDTDFDGIGNNADNDDDGDNHSDYIDDFPLDATEWLDTDGDGIGNNSDADDDNDAVTDDQDAFPLIATEWLDTDGDRIGNNIDRDDDGDLTPDVYDLFPLSERDWQDIDNDGIGDNSDIDTDGDGVPNSLDAFPLNAYEWLDTDNAGVGDNTDNDDDNDDVLDINDAFPLDASESMDTDGDGIGNNADPDDDGDGVNDESDPAPLDPTITGEADQQIISVLGNPVGIVGKSTLVEIGYSTSNGDNTTTGIGFRIHYNSALMNIAKVIDLLEKDLVVEVTGPLPDSEDHDNDANTDQYYSVGWASLYGDWPNETLPAKVLSLQVTIASDIDDPAVTSAPINFSSTAIAADYEFVAENYVLDLITSTWDFDGSGHADALTDGLILLRYGFDLTGDNLVRGVMHPNSEMTAAEVEAKIESAANMIDIDMDGKYSALTDGLLLLRYLFDLTGQNLISDVLSSAAARTSSEAITQHIERHMPADVFDNLQDNSAESIMIALDQEGEISGTADYDNSDFIKMNTVGAGKFTIEITPDNNELDIDCGLTATTGPSVFGQNNFILDDNSAEIYNDLYDSDCKLTARFTDDREFYLFVDIGDGPVTSGSYTVKYSFGVESGEYIVTLGDEGEIQGDADYFNSDFIKMNAIGAGQLTIEITPDNNEVDIDCGLTSEIGPSDFSAVNFITDDNNIEILNDSDDSNCGFTATFVDDREFYLFVDFASEESGSYGISYAFSSQVQVAD